MIVAGLLLTRITSSPSARSALHAWLPGVVELARLADDDRAGADDEDALEVSASRHGVRAGLPRSCEFGRLAAALTGLKAACAT